MLRTRTIALCHESAARQFAPWNSEAENRATKAWIAVGRITPEIAAQEWQAVDEMIEHLQRVRRA